MLSEPNGLFASHPQMKDRLANLEKVIKEKKLTATATRAGALRQEHHVRRQAGLLDRDRRRRIARPGRRRGEEPAEGEKKAEAEKKEEPKKGGGSAFSKLRPGGRLAGAAVADVASAGARGVNPDRDAVGGPNKKRVPVKIGPSRHRRVPEGHRVAQAPAA